MLNLEIPSLGEDARQYRLSEHKVMLENQMWASEKYTFQLIKKIDHIFTDSIPNSTDEPPILAKQNVEFFFKQQLNMR